MGTNAFFYLLVIVSSVSPFTAASGQQQIAKLHSVGTIVDGGPYSFPEKVTLDRFGNLYILDSELSNIFVVCGVLEGAETIRSQATKCNGQTRWFAKSALLMH